MVHTLFEFLFLFYLPKATIKLHFFKHIYCDGILLQKCLNLLGVSCQRQSFDMTSVAPKVFEYCLLKKQRFILLVAKRNI